MTRAHLKKVVTVLSSVVLLSAPAMADGVGSRNWMTESPKGAALRVKIVPGQTEDRLDRGPMKESPKGAAIRVKRAAGVTPDRIDRGVPKVSPRHAVNFPTHGNKR